MKWLTAEGVLAAAAVVVVGVMVAVALQVGPMVEAAVQVAAQQRDLVSRLSELSWCKLPPQSVEPPKTPLRKRLLGQSPIPDAVPNSLN